jgi:hypothetical protein
MPAAVDLILALSGTPAGPKSSFSIMLTLITYMVNYTGWTTKTPRM